MKVDVLLSRLEKVRQTGTNRWTARCPAHDDRRPSLKIAEGNDGIVLVKCFGGCSFYEVLAAVGLESRDLQPERIGEHIAPKRRPFSAAEMLSSLLFEALVVAESGATLLAGEPFSQQDRERLMLAVERISTAVDMAKAQYG